MKTASLASIFSTFCLFLHYTISSPAFSSATNINHLPAPPSPIQCNAVRYGTNLPLLDCFHVRSTLETRDPEDHGTYATFSTEQGSATPAEGNVYVLPQVIRYGGCLATVNLRRGVTTAQALWIDVWDVGSEIIEKCVEGEGGGSGGASYYGDIFIAIRKPPSIELAGGNETMLS